MHLTNYSINKLNDNFIFNSKNEGVGHKRSMQVVFANLKEQGHDVDLLWVKIKKIIIKTLSCGQPYLSHYFKSCQSDDYYGGTCFEILGYHSTDFLCLFLLDLTYYWMQTASPGYWRLITHQAFQLTHL